MPSALVRTLSEPIRRVRELVGPGWSAGPAGDPAAPLTRASAALAGTAANVGRAWRDVGAGWWGAGADAAAEFATATTTAITDAAERAEELAAHAGRAADAVARAGQRLQAILDEFETAAVALEPHLDSPGAARKLLARAREALGRAIAVVEELVADLDRQAAALDARAPAPVPAPPAGAGVAGWSGVSPGAGGLAGSGGGGPSGSWGPSGSPGGWDRMAELAAFTRPDGTELPDAVEFGAGTEVRLPDGSVVSAPNTLAASAVRHALTQLGVPYQWGGTAAGVGLDCSGLTQWAYREAGLNIPRLAQEQDVGAAVAPGALRPGDLAVWDGHVAMVVGHGTMIEAGDPVQLSPIRTDNAGQGFQGFWRPTA